MRESGKSVNGAPSSAWTLQAIRDRVTRVFSPPV
jgi:hypothetical protein